MKNLSQKTLISILAGLVIVFVLARVFRSPALERSLPETVVAIDTAKADVIRITPSGETESVVLKKKDSRWFLQVEGSDKAAEQASVRAMLGYLVKMKPQNLILNLPLNET